MPIVINQAYLTNSDPLQNRTQTVSPDFMNHIEDQRDVSFTSSDDDWEYVSSNSDGTTNTDETKESNSTPRSESKEDMEEECSLMHRCDSTPAFSSFSSIGSIHTFEGDDGSYVLECDSSIDVLSISTNNHDTVLLSHKETNGTMKKIPSFKDMVASNIQQLEDQEREKKTKEKALEDRRRLEAVQRRKKIKPRLVVSPIKRCARSTGDLRSLVIHEEEEGHSGGLGSMAVHEEEEILGASDAMEYYNRKSHGSKGRANGKKIRPDEAKRKEMIIHKKNAQRKAQGAGKKKK